MVRSDLDFSKLVTGGLSPVRLSVQAGTFMPVYLPPGLSLVILTSQASFSIYQDSDDNLGLTVPAGYEYKFHLGRAAGYPDILIKTSVDNQEFFAVGGSDG